jgi:DNA polymerase-3 subunit chi
MTRVDFYVLPDGSDEGPLPTACRLCEKAAGAGKRVLVHAPDADVAREFDRLLWVYKQGGFVAHERVGASTDPGPAAVLIGGDEPPPSHRDVLLNLGDAVPAFFDRFERVLEIVAGDAATRGSSRARFKFYRDRGITPESHKL